MMTSPNPSAELVTAPEKDQRYVGLRAAETLGYFGLGHCPAKSSDFCDFLRCEEFLEARDETGIDGVLLVETIVRPFEIGGKSVRFYPIDMIDDREIVWVGDKSRRNKAVGKQVLRTTVSPQADLDVSEFIDARPEYFAVASLWSTGTQAHSVKASYSAEVADFIEVAEIFDLNRSPLFCESGIHTTGCPSGEIGLAIKSPSHASTFGGFAVMAASSETYNRRLPSP